MDAKKYIILFLFVIIAFSCHKEIFVDDSGSFTIKGTVLDSIQNTPLDDVEIWLWKSELFEDFPSPLKDTLTDSIGKFTVKFEIKSGGGFNSHYLICRKSHYVEARFDIDTKISKQTITIKMVKSDSILVK